MKLDYTQNALGTLSQIPVPIRKAFYKQAAFLVANLPIAARQEIQRG
jgi:hypothetical protein